MKFNKLYCTCGAAVGRIEFSHIDPNLKSLDDGKVYRNEYNGNEARDKDGALIPLRYGRYMCKKCHEEESKDLRTWIATYTKDHGVTTETIKITDKTYTRAYLTASLKIDGIVIDLVEVKS
jgi:hypothetical protein